LINAAISSGQLKDPPRAEQPSLINRDVDGQEQALGINQEAPNDITSGLSWKELKKRKKKKKKKDALLKMMKTLYGDDSDSDSDLGSE
jgi:hypothetical protein